MLDFVDEVKWEALETLLMSHRDLRPVHACLLTTGILLEKPGENGEFRVTVITKSPFDKNLKYLLGSQT